MFLPFPLKTTGEAFREDNLMKTQCSGTPGTETKAVTGTRCDRLQLLQIKLEIEKKSEN